MKTLYPQAVQRPLLGHSEPGTLAQRDLVVLHISVGPSASSAINTAIASKSPNRVSFHFVIDRDPKATVYQLLPLEDTAFHAHGCNRHSIGIEHAAIPNDPAHAITEQQYVSSAALVKWICATLKIPCDRKHVRSHHEADVNTTHVGCCAPTLDPDKVVSLAQGIAQPVLRDNT